MDRIEKLKDMLMAAPDDSFLKHALALEYIKSGHDGPARILFEEILSGQPDYVGSYYHLGKLLERIGDIAGAAGWYQKGMVAARKVGDNHAFNELQAAYEELDL